MPDSALPRTSPSSQGLSSNGVLDFLDAIEAAPQLELHSLMILRHGEVLAEGWWAPYTPSDVNLLYSLSKSFTSTALGFAISEGLLKIDDPVISFFGDFEALATHPWTRSMTVGNLVSMATGHTEDTLERSVALDPVEPIRGFLQIPPDREPGSVFAYNNTATYIVGAIVQQVTGQRLTDYLRPRLFDPLGIDRTPWDSFLGDREIGFSGLHLTTESVARFGALLLDDGVWEGRQLLPAGWVTEASRQHVANPNEPEPDWQQGYGYQFWRSRHGYRGDGAFGQFCLVLPEHDAVVVTTAATEDMQGLLDAVWRHLLPAFDQATSAEADERLAKRLTSLAVTVPSNGVTSSDPWLSVRSVDAAGDDWRLTVVLDDRDVTVDCGSQEWHRTVVEGPYGRLPVEARGSWDTPDRFDAEIAFVETPHHLRVSFWPETQRSEGHWHVAPLGASAILGLATV
jgi:CubicO group peptidase (beta-lactamase class C family)